MVAVTQIKEEEDFYLGHDFSEGLGFSKPQIEKLVKDGSIVPLEEGIPLKKTQSLWLTQNNEIYLADCIDSMGDADKRRIA